MRISLSFEHAKQRTQEEIHSLPEFSLRSAEKTYKLTDSIYIDNVHGIGQTPDNRSVLYKGFVAKLSIDMFLRMALPTHDGFERASRIVDKIEHGYGIGSPCFYLNIDSFVHATSDMPMITGHEGRARCIALQMLGMKEIPIQFLFIGYRARHVESVADFTAYLNAGLIDQNRVTRRNLFRQLYFA